MFQDFIFEAVERLRAGLEAAYVATPRLLLAIALALIALLAFLLLCAPIELVCSYKSGTFCSIASYAAPRWLEGIGSAIQNIVLCRLSQTTCEGGMQLADIQSVAQLLLGYTLTLNLINSFWEHYQKTLNNLRPRLCDLVFVASESEPAGEADFIGLVEARLRMWEPIYRLTMSMTFGFVRVSYVFTAFASACLLLLTFIDRSQTLPFQVPQAIIFALAPLLAIGLLFIIFGILEKLIDVCIVPAVFRRRNVNGVVERRLYEELDIPTQDDSDFYGANI